MASGRLMRAYVVNSLAKLPAGISVFFLPPAKSRNTLARSSSAWTKENNTRKICTRGSMQSAAGDRKDEAINSSRFYKHSQSDFS